MQTAVTRSLTCVWRIVLTMTACALATLAQQPRPRMVSNLERYGYTTQLTASNREFFALGTPKVLNALNANTRLVPLSAGILLVYVSRPAEGDRAWITRSLRAWFVDTATGALIRQQAWRTRLRVAPSDLLDSEARIFAAANGRYLVSAQDTLYLFDDHGVKVTEYKPPDGTHSSVSVTPDKSQIMVRSADNEGRTTYAWLDGATLELKARLSRSELPGGVMPFSAVENGVVFGGPDGLDILSISGMDRTLCSKPACQDVWPLPLASDGFERMAFRTNYGLGVTSMEGKLLWSKTISQGLDFNQMRFPAFTASADGRNLALEILRGGRKNRYFDGVHLDNGREIMVFDTDTGRRILIVPIAPGDEDVALSTDGRTPWTFGGKVLKAFDVPN